MKYECDMIRDLLPLYKDEACSKATSQVVEEHIAECPDCAGLLKSMKDSVIDELMLKEKNEVLGSQAKFFKRKSALAGSVIAAIFAIPILICLIVDLAGGNGLGWFFVVLASMLVPTALIVVPLMAPKNRMFLTMVSFTASLLILLAVICIYTRGNWFFVAGASALFGLTVAFSPFIACRRPVKEKLGNCKGLTVMAADTVTFYLMLICIGLYVDIPGFFRNAFAISVPLIVTAWIVFAVVRYLPVNGLLKGGICTVLLSICSYALPELIIAMIRSGMPNPEDLVVSSSGQPLTMICGLVTGAVLILAGLLAGNKAGKKNP